MRRASSRIAVSTTSFKSTTRGRIICLRPKASSCAVSDAAVSAAFRTSRSRSCTGLYGPEVVARELDVADDRGQQVVEVVRDAPREAADRLEPARVVGLVIGARLGHLRLHARGRVADDHDDRGDAGQRRQAHVHLGPEQAAVLAPAVPREQLRRSRGRRPDEAERPVPACSRRSPRSPPRCRGVSAPPWCSRRCRWPARSPRGRRRWRHRARRSRR